MFIEVKVDGKYASIFHVNKDVNKYCEIEVNAVEYETNGDKTIVEIGKGLI